MAFFGKSALELITPTSVSSTGSGNSSSINTNGSVSFSSCATLSINGVFSATYENYMCVCRVSAGSTTSQNVELRLRTSVPADDATSNYHWQWIQADGTTANASQSTGVAQCRLGVYAETGKVQGATFYVCGPFLSVPTVMYGQGAGGYLDAYLIDYAANHNVSSSFAGFSLIPTAGTFNGKISVYGMVK